MNRLFIKIFLLIFTLSFNSIFAGESVVLRAAKKELTRFMDELKGEPTPPYFIAYGITDTKEINIAGTFGKIITDDDEVKRTLDIDLRVGDYKFDNTHIIRGESFNFFMRDGSTILPFEDDEKAMRNAIWFATDRKYKKAVERYEKALTNSAVKVKEEDTSADFSHEEPSIYFGEDVNFQFDKELWKKRIENVSAIFAKYDWLYTGYVTVSFKLTKKYFINSEGTEIEMTEPYARVFISAKTKAEDGMSLPLYKSYFAFNPKELPDENVLIQEAVKIINTLDEMRTAPIMSTYSGPALLSGEASGVFFHEIFGHRVEGHRLKDPNNAQTYKGFLGESVLPDFIDVIFDPTIKKVGNTELSGYYLFDDEGIKAQKVDVVEKGIFKNFLMSRSPIENFDKSNGHGRKQSGYDAVSRQSNLIVKTDKSLPVDELKDKLREECKEQDKDFGLYFVKVQGGFTFTGRTIPNSFNVNPVLVYKIFVDGRADELVRGVDLIGTPLTTFSNIIDAGDDIGIFNGTCGAESGGVPVSAVSPTLLVQKIEVQKKSKSQAKLPILPAPADNDNQ
ncbi:TldD/PmbA family protein [Bacteroidota bacterium]